MRKSKVVTYPKPSLAGFRLDRTLASNTLMKNQFDHFVEVEKRLPAGLKTGIDTSRIKHRLRPASSSRT